MCNRLIKFGAFHEKKGREYDYIATGHYACTETDERRRRWLCTSPDPVKDQTDFLSRIMPWQLRKALFPIGHLMKEEVRRIAVRERLVNAERKDSQGICFLGKTNYNEYIRRYVGECPGDVVEAETGKTIGRHRGLWFHTIGQRKGLGFGGGPWFVTRKDMKNNVLYVSRGYDPESVYRKEFTVTGMNWLTAPIETGADGTAAVTFKIRHTPDYCKARIEDRGDGTYRVYSEERIHGVAQGQFCTVYDEEHRRCYGSAEIADQDNFG